MERREILEQITKNNDVIRLTKFYSGPFLDVENDLSLDPTFSKVGVMTEEEKKIWTVGNIIDEKVKELKKNESFDITLIKDLEAKEQRCNASFWQSVQSRKLVSKKHKDLRIGKGFSIWVRDFSYKKKPRI